MVAYTNGPDFTQAYTHVWIHIRSVQNVIKFRNNFFYNFYFSTQIEHPKGVPGLP